jgi:hypothetical protein
MDTEENRTMKPNSKYVDQIQFSGTENAWLKHDGTLEISGQATKTTSESGMALPYVTLSLPPEFTYQLLHMLRNHEDTLIDGIERNFNAPTAEEFSEEDPYDSEYDA